MAQAGSLFFDLIPQLNRAVLSAQARRAGATAGADMGVAIGTEAGKHTGPALERSRGSLRTSADKMGTEVGAVIGRRMAQAFAPVGTSVTWAQAQMRRMSGAANESMASVSRDTETHMARFRAIINSSTTQANTAFTRMGAAIDRSSKSSDKMNTSLGGAAIRATALARVMSTIAIPGGIVAAIPYVASLASSAGQAAGALLLLPAAGAAAGIGMATLKVGVAGFGQAMKDLGDPKKFAEDIAKLSPAARDAALSVRGLVPAWTSMQQVVQQNLFAGVSGQISGLAGIYLPMLRTGLGGVAVELNASGIALANWARQAATIGAVQTIFTNVRNTMQALHPVGVAIASIFLDIATVGSGFLPGLATGFANAAEKAAAFISSARQTGELARWIEGGLAVLRQLGALAWNVGSVLTSIFQLAKGEGESFLGTLVRVTGSLDAALKTPAGAAAVRDFFAIVRGVVEGLIEKIIILWPAIQAAGRAFFALSEAAAPLLDTVFRLVATAMVPLLDALTWMAPVLGPLIAGFFLISGIMSVWAGVMSVVSSVMTVVRGLTVAWTAVQWLLNSAFLANPITWVVIGIIALIAAIIWAWNNCETFRNIVIGVWEAIKTAIGGVINFISTVVSGFVPFWTNLWTTVSGWFVNVWNSIWGFALFIVGAIVGWIVGQVSGFVGFWSGVWSAVSGWFVNTWNTLFGFALFIVTALVDFIVMVVTRIVNFWIMVWTLVSSFFIGVWNSIYAFGAMIVGVIVGFISARINEFLAFWGFVWTSVSNFFITIWNAIWGFIGPTVMAIVGWISARINEFLAFWGFVWTSISNFFTTIWNVIWATVQYYWGLLQFYYNVALYAFLAFWSGIWNSIVGFFVGIWNNIWATVQYYWGLLQFYYNVALYAFLAFWSGIWNNIVGFFVGIWNNIWATVQYYWGLIKFYYNVALAVFQKLWKDSWDDIVGTFDRIWTGIKDIAYRVWEGVKNTFKDAINWIIDRINDFAGAINNVAKLLGFDINLHVNRLDGGGSVRGPVTGSSTAAGLAAGGGVNATAGGRLPYTGTRRDTLPALAGNQRYLLAGDEYVVQRRAAQAIGSAGMDAINNAYRWPLADRRSLSANYADGGPIRRLATGDQIEAAAVRLVPGSRATSKFRPGVRGYHGTNQAADMAGNLMAIDQAWAKTYGPTTTQLIYTPGINILNGRPHKYNAKDAADHFDHVHIAYTGFLGGPTGSIGEGGEGGGIALIRPAVEAALNPLLGILKPIRDDRAKGFGSRSGAGGGVKVIEGIYDKATKADELAMQASSNIGTAVASGPILAMLTAAAAQFGWLGQMGSLNALVGHESGFNPNAQNPTSTAYGLFQFLNSTWAGVGGTKTSNPALQILYGLRYIKNSYRDPNGAWAFWQSHHWYDEGGMLQPGLNLAYNGTNRPEPVLTSEQFAALAGGTRGGDEGPLIGQLVVQVPEQATARDVVDEINFAVRHGRRGVHARGRR